jgi:non-specific serine/threonine protein kinase
MDGVDAGSLLELAEQAAAELRGPEGGAWKERLEAEYERLTAAIGWFIASGDGPEALRLAVALFPFWVDTGRNPDGKRWLEAALSAPGAGEPTATRVQALYAAGLLAFREGDESRSRALNEEALRSAEQSGDRAGAARAHIGLARVAFRGEDHEALRAHAETSLDLARALGDEELMGTSLHMLAESARVQGELRRARELYDQCLAIDRRLDNQRAVALELHNLAYVDRGQGELSRAEARFRESLTLAHHLHDAGLIMYCALGLGVMAGEQGDSERAATLLSAVSAMLEASGEVLDPAESEEYERAVATARERLAPSEFESVWERGRGMPQPEVVSFALGHRSTA